MILDVHRQGLTVAAIARQAGVDRKTIRKYIARGLKPPAYGPRQPRPRGLEADENHWAWRARNQDQGAIRAFRVIYLATLPEAVLVLHAFRKKTQATPQKDIELAADRLRAWRKE